MKWNIPSATIAWMPRSAKKNGKSYVVVVMVEHGGGGSHGGRPCCPRRSISIFLTRTPISRGQRGERR